MKDILILLPILIKMRLRAMSQTRGRSRWGRYGLGIVMLISFVMLAAMWTAMLYGASLLLDGASLLTVAFLVAMLCTLIFSVVMIFGELFNSKDAEHLASLPLSGSSVFTAKFVMVYFAELLTTAFFALPAVGVVGYTGGLGAMYWVSSIAAVLLLPMVPLCIATFFALILSRFAAFIKHRDKLTIIFGFTITLLFVFGNQFISSRMSLTMADGDYSEIAGMLSGVSEIIARVFPPALYAAGAALGGAMSWLFYALMSFGALALCVLVASRFYYTALSAGREALKKGGKRGGLKLEGFKATSALGACIRREYLTTVRSVTYAMNSLIGVVMFPMMLVIIPMTTGSMSAADSAELTDLLTMLGVSNFGMIFAIAYAAGFFLCMTNLTASTAFSREGRSFAVTKSIPVPYRTQAYGKLIFAIIVSSATLILSVAAAMYALPATLWTPVLLGGVCALGASVVPQSLGLIIDMSRPKLVWTTEAEAIKQNANGVYGMLLGLLIGVVMSAPVFVASVLVGYAAAVAVCAVITAGAAAASLWLVGVWADKRLDRIEL